MSKTYLVDTNVILRLLIGDIVEQKNLAQGLFEKAEAGEVKLTVSLLVINELVWILEKFYDLKRKDYIPSLNHLLAVRGLTVIEVKKSRVMRLLEALESSKLDLTDLYLLQTSKNLGHQIYTFDQEMIDVAK